MPRFRPSHQPAKRAVPTKSRRQVQHRSHNGSNEIDNYVPACATCNLSRGNRATPKG
ncbi:HNH endonuclease [Nonomuraea sp. NBC_00507]|uniref:HNH endonuclease n=1 Tax=Nonomuraea sp. NBC_00507 TaxID=2976002 RepID=UPI003FA596ED